MKKLAISSWILCMMFVFLTGCGNTELQDADSSADISHQETVNEQNNPSKEEVTHNHNYVESIKTEPTCLKEGDKTFTCECGDEYTEAIVATGHDYEEVEDSLVEATCETDGKDVDQKCSLCGDLVTGAIVVATGHSFIEYVSNEDATYVSDGTETATCTCGVTDTRIVEGSKLEYTYTEFVKIMYAISSANVRDLPSTDGNKLGKVGEGDQVSVISKCNETGWYGISYNNSVAYVSGKYLSEEEPEPTYDLGDGIKRKYGVLYVNTCGKHLTNEPTLCESLGPFPYPMYTLLDNGDGTYTVYIVNNHGGFYDGQWTTFETKTGYSHELKNQGYTVEYYGGDDYHACVGGYDEGCIHKWIVYK